MNYKRLLPNIITVIRMISASVLLFLEPLSTAFYATYTIGGISDAFDGFLARRWKTESRIGSILDSIADLFFFAVMFLTLMPTLLTRVSTWMWCVMGLILLGRILNYAFAGIKFKKFASLHTYLNKVTGFSLFLVPYMLPTELFALFCVLLLAVGTVAVIEEAILHARTAPGEEAGQTILPLNKGKSVAKSFHPHA